MRSILGKAHPSMRNNTSLTMMMLRQYSFSMDLSKFNSKKQKEKQKEYDLIVVGGGSGGIAAASRASELGAKVACFNGVVATKHGNKWGLGGTCVNVGCIPKKLLHISSQYRDVVTNGAKSYGFESTTNEHSWSALQDKIMEHYVRALNFSYTSKLNVKHVEFQPQYVASVAEDGSIKTQKGEEFKAKNIVIATGCRPVELDVEGYEHTITSDDLFFQKKHPGKTLIIGSGYIAVECAGFIASLGANEPVHMAVRSNQILRSFDREAVDHLLTQKENHYGSTLKIDYEAIVTKIEKLETKKLKVTFKKGQTETYDTVLVAIGRKPSWDNLSLPSSVQIDKESNRIIVNDQHQTHHPSIYAIGDAVHDSPELTPVAIHDGKSLANTLYGTKNSPSPHHYVATTIFTSPMEYASVGVSQLEISDDDDDIKVYRKRFNILEYMLRDSPYPGFIKIICQGPEERVIGFHLISLNAGEIAQAVSLAMNLGVTKDQLDHCIGIHPTIAEVMTNLVEGVEEDDGC